MFCRTPIRVKDYQYAVIKHMEYCMHFGTLEFNDTIRANVCEVCIFIFHM